MDFWYRLSFRARLKIIASAFAAISVILLLLWFRGSAQFSFYQFGSIICFAFLVCLFWLAWSDLEKIPWWKWIVILVLVIICSIRPTLWLVGVPIIGFVLFGEQTTRRKR